MTRFAFGWIADTPDHRDRIYQVPVKEDLPSMVTWRGALPAAFDQGDLGSCTANAIAGALMAQAAYQQKPIAPPSRLFIYYEERALEHTIASDAGAMIRDGIKVVNRKGAPPEPDWPYDIAKFTERPPAEAYRDALLRQALTYQRVVSTSLYSLQHCLKTHGPIVIGVSVYESFMDAAKGAIPLPRQQEQMLGGHAILLTGYNNEMHRFEFRNSWGPTWGDAGYGTLPYTYLTDADLADDAWAITLVETP